MSMDLARVLELLETGITQGWHDCAQIYLSRNGEVLLDTAVGEISPGRPLRTDDLMLWYSSGKPLTVVAILQLWEQGRIGLDDLVAKHLDGWANGKERCTLRQVLVHTGGFPIPGDPMYDSDVTWDEAVAATIAATALWEPGTAAGYHPASGWRALGAVVQAVAGRRIDEYVRDEITRPLGLDDAHLGIPVERQREYGDRIVPVVWRGHRFPSIDKDGNFYMAPYYIDRVHNEPWHIAKVEPGGGMRGPARDLGRFYESLLGFGPPVLEPRTVEVMRSVHRWGVRDRTFNTDTPWGLGVQVDFSGGTTRRAFGHGGMASSRALADPECGLVMVVVANGLAGYMEAEQRVLEITDAVYSALGDEVARLRRSVTSVAAAVGLST
ncbi:MAG: class A beta-lactamase-related serine hydrolase [Acidimicrobiia bacterium]|nr:class A beta-lactamase-related serine hydrolase [Acidimicrobiia bacterium]